MQDRDELRSRLYNPSLPFHDNNIDENNEKEIIKGSFKK